MDAVGGELNAFTAKEYTCYYARVLDADLPLAIDVLSDMVTSSLIEPKEVDAERGVILEEIAMNEDDPADLVHEAFSELVFGDTPLGRPILGTVDSINSITRDRIAEHYRARYTPDHLVVAAAGSLDHDQVVELTAAAFGAVLTRPGHARRAAPDRTAGRRRDRGTGVRLVSRPVEQANLVLGCAGLARNDDRRFALGVLNAALGGGMSSRLFQEVREKRGLAYSVYSFSSQHADCGQWGIYAGCLPAKTEEVLAICQDEIAKVIESGLTDEELDRGQGSAPRLYRARPGRPVVPDEPARQVRAGLPAAGAGRRDPGPDRGRHARPGPRGRGCGARPAEGAGHRGAVRRRCRVRRGAGELAGCSAALATGLAAVCAVAPLRLSRGWPGCATLRCVPASQTPGPLIGSGRSADVYALGDGRVVRRFRTPYDAQPEAELMRHLAAAGYPVPAVYDADGPDLVMERLDGRDMLADLGRRPWLVAPARPPARGTP